MELIKVGKIVNTHGIKGELKILSRFEYKHLVFVKDQIIFIDDSSYQITNYRHHQQFELITLNGFNNINDVLLFKGKNIYVDRSSLSLDQNILATDLIGYQVFDQGLLIGEVVDLEDRGAGLLLVVQTKDKKIFIPKVDAFIENIDQHKYIINIHHWEGLYEN